MSTMIKNLGRAALMMTLALSLVALGGSSQSAEADEVVRLNASAKLRSRPGERAPSIANLSSGQTVRVVGQKGRWLKVSARGRVGWITRTQVSVDEAPVSARATTQRARKTGAPKARSKKGWKTMDDDAVGADAADETDETDEMDEEEEDEVPAAIEQTKKRSVKPRAVKKVAKAKKKAKKAAMAEGAMVVLKADVSVRQRPSKKADELYPAEEGEEVKVVTIDEDGEWVRVQADDGTKGWVEAKALAMKSSGDDDSDDEESEDGEDGESEDDEVDESDDSEEGRLAARTKQGTLTYSLNGNLGILSKSQDYTSMGTGDRSNYGLANMTPTVIVGGVVQKRMGKEYSVGAEGSYVRTFGGSGIVLDGGMAMGGETLTWVAQAIDLRGTVGYDVSKGKYQLVGRVGYHRASVTIAESTTAMLPSELITGYTVGIGLDAPMLSPKMGLRIGADMLMGATLAQTPGYQDGETSALKAYYVNAVGNYNYKKNIDLMATYTLSYEGFGFTGTNEREATAAGAQRKDLQHVIGIGGVYKF